jgi:opacity protein-like surface antigen
MASRNGTLVEKYDPGAKASTPNLGVGVKYLIGNSAALRLEYRYRHFRINDPYEEEIDHITYNTIILGLSLFF